MEYIHDTDYAYITEKYRDLTNRSHTSNRFVRNDALFAESTGLTSDEILEGIRKQDSVLSHLSHPVRKAKAFAYVLEHTRINCDSRDRFPAIHMIDRPLNKTVIAAWNNEVFTKIIPEVNPIRSAMEKNAIATMWTDYDHSVPYWDRILPLGFAGILRERE